MKTSFRPFLHWYCVFVAAATLFLIVAGAAVTSKEAGLSVPDWPLSYGKVMPEMTGMVFFEHGHRMIASGVGLLTVIMAILLAVYEDRKWLKKLGFAAVGLVILQGTLGGLTVLMKLPPEISIAHASTAQIFFSLTVAIALFTSRGFVAGKQPVPDTPSAFSLRTLATITPVLIYAQLIMGAAFRHKAAGLIPHLLGAAVVFMMCILTALIVIQQYGKTQRNLYPWAHALLGIIFVQIGLGIAAYITRLKAIDLGYAYPGMVHTTVTHVATGALCMAIAVALAIQVRRNVVATQPETVFEQKENRESASVVS
jgi:heme a synthase